jgi:hypothetical protein
MNFETWLYGQSKHPRRESALKTLAALGAKVQYSPLRGYFIFRADGQLWKTLYRKEDAVRFLADVTDHPEEL